MAQLEEGQDAPLLLRFIKLDRQFGGTFRTGAQQQLILL
jgi:hypothetical protein